MTLDRAKIKKNSKVTLYAVEFARVYDLAEKQILRMEVEARQAREDLEAVESMFRKSIEEQTNDR